MPPTVFDEGNRRRPGGYLPHKEYLLKKTKQIIFCHPWFSLCGLANHSCCRPFVLCLERSACVTWETPRATRWQGTALQQLEGSHLFVEGITTTMLTRIVARYPLLYTAQPNGTLLGDTFRACIFIGLVSQKLQVQTESDRRNSQQHGTTSKSKV